MRTSIKCQSYDSVGVKIVSRRGEVSVFYRRDSLRSGDSETLVSSNTR